MGVRIHRCGPCESKFIRDFIDFDGIQTYRGGHAWKRLQHYFRTIGWFLESLFLEVVYRRDALCNRRSTNSSLLSYYVKVQPE